MPLFLKLLSQKPQPNPLSSNAITVIHSFDILSGLKPWNRSTGNMRPRKWLLKKAERCTQYPHEKTKLYKTVHLKPDFNQHLTSDRPQRKPLPFLSFLSTQEKRFEEFYNLKFQLVVHVSSLICKIIMYVGKISPLLSKRYWSGWTRTKDHKSCSVVDDWLFHRSIASQLASRSPFITHMRLRVGSWKPTPQA